MAHICQHLATLARTAPHRQLTSCEGREQTAAEFVARVAALSAALVLDLGLRAGDRVALAAVNTDRHFEALLAILAAGGLVAPLNWRWSLQDGVTAVAPCAPSILITDGPCSRFRALAEHLTSLRHTVTLGTGAATDAVMSEQLISRHTGAQLRLRAPDNNAAVLCFTSGTTAAPKAAVLSHTAFHVQSMNKLLEVGYCAEDVMYHVAPLCHIGGLSSALAVLMAGGRHVFPGRFEPARMQWELEQHQVTSFIVVPAMLAALWEVTGERRAYAHVRRVLIGGGTPTAAMLGNASRMFPAASIKLSYAMTEACSSMTFSTIAAPGNGRPQPDAIAADAPPPPQQQRPQQRVTSAVCVGRPAPGVEIDIEPVEGLEPGQGVIRTRGPHVMLGYWSEGGSALRPHPERWLSTGDIGFLDEAGQLWLNGRSRDTIRTGSETVHASEVERCLQLHPDVLVAAVVGLPHERLGQQVAALVQLRAVEKQPADAWQEQLRSFCKFAGLSGYKVPRVVCCQSAPLPANSSGKLLKHEAQAVMLRLLLPMARSKL